MRLTFTLLAFYGAAMLPAQDVNKPAPVISIIREGIKEGRGPAHERVETEWAAAMRKMNFPQHYIALGAASGPSEVWFISPMATFASQEDVDKFEEKEPVKGTMGMLESRDGELRATSRSMWAVYRPDMSYRAEKFNPAKARYVMVANMRIKLGQEQTFAEAGKAYFAAHEKANVDECILGYQVVAGAQAGTYLFFTMMESMKDLDAAPARMQAVQQAMGRENYIKFMRSSGDIFVTVEDTLFQVKPSMSYAPQNIVDADPAFWKPKPMAAKPAAAAPAAEKKQ